MRSLKLRIHQTEDSLIKVRSDLIRICLRVKRCLRRSEYVVSLIVSVINLELRCYRALQLPVNREEATLYVTLFNDWNSSTALSVNRV